ncbi:MAG: Tn3 family transposase [Chloroflexota bacterium]
MADVLHLGAGLSVPRSEISVETSRASGPGGQKVNKTETKVTLRFDIEANTSLPEGVRARLKEKLGRRLTKNGELLVTAEEHRLQSRNLDTAFDRLQAGLRSGDISVTGSHRYQAFDDYLLSQEAWQRLKREGQTRLAVSDDPHAYLEGCQAEITTLLQQVAEVIGQEDSHLWLDEQHVLHLKRLEKVTPPEVKALRRQLYRFVPQIEMSQMIADVNQWTDVLGHFNHLLSGEAPIGHHQEILTAALMASGMNIGPTKMAQASDFSEQELIHSAMWHIRDETLYPAIAELDNFVLHHPYSRHWGSGISSSSDGMRVPVVVDAPNAIYNARHFWYRRGITIVTHAADIWMPFFPQVVQDASEALYVIDALCHHETDFDIREHYTDTASATYHLFALCRMLGFRFAPRIRGVAKRYLYTVEPLNVDKALQPLIRDIIDSELVTTNWDEMRRLAASIRHSKVSASLMMRKLASYPNQNRLALAFKEVGKLERTIFVLTYLLDLSLQRRNLRGLNKGEAIWSAARAISSIGRGSEMYDRDFDAQLNRASSTMLLVAMLSTWNTVYLDKTVSAFQANGMEIPEEYLGHISPLGWQHINMLGRYQFDLTHAYPLQALRPLRQPVI